jgi:hypothetical protein
MYYGWSHASRQNHKIITLSSSQDDWEIYCEFRSIPYYYLRYGIEAPPSSGGTITASYQLTGLSLTVTNSSLDYQSRFAGNGMSSGFDSDNYYGSFYLNDSQDSQKMIFAVKCGGFGMKFGPNRFNYLLPDNYYIPMFIPIVYFDIDPLGKTILIVPKK